MNTLDQSRAKLRNLRRMISGYYQVHRLDFFLSWFIDSTESLCCGWCKFFSFIPSSTWVPGESLDKCFLVFHNNYLWALMFSGLGPSSFSSSRKEFRMISSCKMKYKSNLPFILCVVLADCIDPAVSLYATARRNETLPQLWF